MSRDFLRHRDHEAYSSASSDSEDPQTPPNATPIHPPPAPLFGCEAAQQQAYTPPQFDYGVAVDPAALYAALYAGAGALEHSAHTYTPGYAPALAYDAAFYPLVHYDVNGFAIAPPATEDAYAPIAPGQGHDVPALYAPVPRVGHQPVLTWSPPAELPTSSSPHVSAGDWLPAAPPPTAPSTPSSAFASTASSSLASASFAPFLDSQSMSFDPTPTLLVHTPPQQIFSDAPVGHVSPPGPSRRSTIPLPPSPAAPQASAPLPSDAFAANVQTAGHFMTPAQMLRSSMGKRKRESSSGTGNMFSDDEDNDIEMEPTGRRARDWAPMRRDGTGAAQLSKHLTALAADVGFMPTDPDKHSLHDKKRNYVDCMEQYTLFLHEQLRLVGHAPVSPQKAPSYKGLGSRSMRTMIVHTQNKVRSLHQKVLDEERVFLDLHRQYEARAQAAERQTKRQRTYASGSPTSLNTVRSAAGSWDVFGPV